MQKLVFRYVLQDNQQYHIDDIELYPNGGPYIFRAVAPAGETYHVKEILLSLVVDTTSWTKDHFLTISGGLDKGLLIRQRDLSVEDVHWSVNLTDNLTMFTRLCVCNQIDYASSIKQFLLRLEPAPASVKITDDLAIEVLVRDNLSTLNALRAYVQYGGEIDA